MPLSLIQYGNPYEPRQLSHLRSPGNCLTSDAAAVESGRDAMADSSAAVLCINCVTYDFDAEGLGRPAAAMHRFCMG